MNNCERVPYASDPTDKATFRARKTSRANRRLLLQMSCFQPSAVAIFVLFFVQNIFNQAATVLNSILPKPFSYNFQSCNNFYRTGLLHEIGHALGLGHVKSNMVMNPIAYKNFSHLQTGDIKGVQTIYGIK